MTATIPTVAFAAVKDGTAPAQTQPLMLQLSALEKCREA
jgi:hypothetical protein